MKFGVWEPGACVRRGNDGQEGEMDPADREPTLNPKRGNGKPSKREL